MRILYLLQDLPYPLTNGVRVKLFNLISYMAKSHKCHILSFGDKDLHSRALELQKKIPGIQILNLFPLNSGFTLYLKRLNCLLHRKPLFLSRWNNNTFAKVIRQTIEVTHYDVVHLDALAMAPYVHLCHPTPTIISTTDAVSLIYRRAARANHSFFSKIYQFLTSRSIARFEHDILPLFNKVHVVSKLDRDYLRSQVPKANVECIEHVVPDEVLQYPRVSYTSLPRNGRRILFTGKLRWNSISNGFFRFLSVAYPVIQQKCSDVEMVVLGGSVPVNMRKQIENISGVRFVEWVDDYCAEIIKAHVVVFPDWSGTGVKTRVLYALTLGKPVVASPVALEGIDVSDGVNCFERKVDNGFAQAVILLLNNQELRKTIGQNARRLILDKYTPEISGQKWLELYRCCKENESYY